MSWGQIFSMLGQGIVDTLVVTLGSTLLAYLLGAPIGIILYGTAKNSLFSNRPVNAILGVIVNVLRSIPFIILLILTQPVAKAVVGTKLGNSAFIVYLVIAATPFVARMIESSLREVDGGVIEAAQDLGSNNWQVFRRVILPLSAPGIVSGVTMVFVPAVSTFVISKLLGGSKNMMIGDVIETMFVGDGCNYNVGAALSLVLMVLMLLCMSMMRKVDNGEDELGGMMT